MTQPHRYRHALTPVCLAAAAAAAIGGCGSPAGDTSGKGSPGALPATLVPAPSASSASSAGGSASTAPVPSVSPAATPTPTVLRTAPTAAAEDLSSCYDGSCTITVTRPVTVPLDASRFGFASFRVTALTADGVTIAADSDGNHLRSTGGAGSLLTLNNLSIQVLSAGADAARLTFAATGR